MQWARGLRGWTSEFGPQGGRHVRAVPAFPHAAAENKVGGQRRGGRGVLGRASFPWGWAGPLFTLSCSSQQCWDLVLVLSHWFMSGAPFEAPALLSPEPGSLLLASSVKTFGMSVRYWDSSCPSQGPCTGLFESVDGWDPFHRRGQGTRVTQGILLGTRHLRRGLSSRPAIPTQAETGACSQVPQLPHWRFLVVLWPVQGVKCHGLLNAPRPCTVACPGPQWSLGPICAVPWAWW